MIQKLTKATTRLLAILFAMFATTGGAWAAKPVAVWDGDFTTMTKGTYTLSENGNTKTDTYLQISGDNGVLVTSTEAINVFTVIVRCSGLDLSSENNQVLFTSNETSPNTRGNLTGVILPANNAVCRGIWNGSAWDPNSSTAGYSSFVHNSVPAKYTTIIYNHQQTNGTYAYALGPTSDVDDTVLRTTLYSIQGLRSSGSTYSGCAIGGLRGTTSTTLLPATGLKITSIAVFSGTLTEDEMKHYTFPSETINVSSDTTVSAIKAQVPANQMIAVSAADGVTITVDEAFGNIVSVSSEGNVILAAASQPEASYFSGVDFSGVQGALLRPWVTDVVGFNFNAGQGNDTSTALVSGTWTSDSSGGSGSSTALFADGLSKLTWSSRGYYQWSSGSSFIRGYLDDNSTTQPSISLSNVPYATYDVIIYCATDSGNGFKFSAKQVNGTYYTWNGTTTVSTESSAAAWGTGGDITPAYGTNTLRVKNLSGPIAIKGGPYSNNNSGKYRGSIAAIQVINTTHEATISSAGEYTLAGLFTSVDDSGHYVINVNESATLNIGSATTVGGVTFNVAADKTLTLSGANTLTASSGIIVKGSGIVVAPAAGTLAGTVKGNGTLVYTTTPSGITLTDTNWKGVLWLKNCAIAGIVPANIGSANSTLRLTGVTGYFNNGGNTSTCEGTLDLQDDGDKKAFTVDNGWSQDGITIFGKLTGSGSLVCKTRDISQRYVFKDPSAFTGTINCERTDSAGHFYLRVILGDGASLAPRSGTITVVSGATATVAPSKTWNAWGIDVDGTLNVGAGSTIPSIVSGSEGIVQITSAGKATISGVKDNAISSSLVMMGGNIAVVDTEITELTIPAENYITFFAMNGKLDLSGCTSLTTLKLNLGSGTTFDLANVTLPASCETVNVDVGTARILTGYTISNLGTATLGFSATETNEEYGQGTFSVSNVPSGANVSVTRADGTTSNAIVTDGTARLADYGTVKISGAATAYDVTFTNTSALAYMRTSASVRNNSASVPDDYYNSAAADKSTGLYIYKTPWIADPDGYNLTDMGNFQDSMSLAVVGQMPSAENNTIFIHLGGSSSKNGFLIARSTEENRVIVAYNKNSAVTRLTTMTVPNADSTRHVYIITKQDDTVNNKSVFTIYLDGIKWKTAEVSPILSISGGVQVGSDFGAQIRGIENEDGTIYVQAGEGDTGYVNCIRIYDRVLTQTEINQYSDPSEYPYTSPNGSSARTFTAASENWIDATPSSEVWSNSDDTRSGTPLSGASLNVTAGVDTEVTVNLASEAHYESLTVGGASTTFAAGTAAVKVIGMTVIGTTVTNEYGAVDMAGGPMTITEDGDITFDYSSYDISAIYTTTEIPLTSDVDEAETKVHLIAPSASCRTVSLVYVSGHYAMRVTPDHVAGSEVYFASGYLTGNMGGGINVGTVYLDTAHTHQTVLFPGDTMVIDDNSSLWENQVWVSDTFIGNLKITRTSAMALHNGELTEPILVGKAITVADGASLTISKHTSNALTLGALTINGEGAVGLSDSLTLGGALSGTATVTVNGSVSVDSTGSIANTISGSGTITYASFPSTTPAGFSSWTGTVALPSLHIEALNLNAFGVRGSKVALAGITGGYLAINNLSINPELVLNGDVSIPAMSEADYTLAKISGSGNLSLASNNEQPTSFTIAEVAEDYTGTISSSLDTPVTITTLVRGAGVGVVPGTKLLDLGDVDSANITVTTATVGGTRVPQTNKVVSGDRGIYIIPGTTFTVY